MAVELAKYGFLFAIALIWIIFATIQDLKKREVPNWLNFSLVAFALAYRAFFSAYSSEWSFFIFGVLGFAIFFGLANLFYYSHVFAGGDAKLLMGLGIVLPYSNYFDFLTFGFGFIAVLFFLVAAYSLIYSVFIARKNYSRFALEFKKNLGKMRYMFISLLFVVVFAFVSLVLGFFSSMLLFVYLVLAILLFLLFVYVKSLDVCIIKSVHPKSLTEGDWIVGDIKLRGYVVKKSVHGLGEEDIERLRKAGKMVLVKEGIPFTPAFLFAFLAMVFFFSFSGLDFLALLF